MKISGTYRSRLRVNIVFFSVIEAILAVATKDLKITFSITLGLFLFFTILDFLVLTFWFKTKNLYFINNDLYFNEVKVDVDRIDTILPKEVGNYKWRINLLEIKLKDSEKPFLFLDDSKFIWQSDTSMTASRLVKLFPKLLQNQKVYRNQYKQNFV